jgi:hypothetical protein
MSASRDDHDPVDAFADEDGLSINDLPEDDPWTAFAAEPAALEPEEPVAAASATTGRAAVTAARAVEDVAPRLALAAAPTRHPRGVRGVSWRPAIAAVAVAATVLIVAAAGAYLFNEEPVDLNDQIAAVIDTPPAPPADAEPEAPSVVDADAPSVAAEADAPRVPATEVVVPPVESASEPAPSVRASRSKPVARNGTARAAARHAKPSVPPPSSSQRSATDTNTVAQASSGVETSKAATVVDVTADAAPLAGDWVMNTRVESSQLQRYEGLRLGYVLSLRQDGDRISGTGWKVREDDRTIRAASRTPINVDGVMTGDRVELTFTEGGRRRTSAGKLILARDSEDVFRGRFSSTAAQSVGVVEIRR